MKRRSFIALAATAGALALSGCDTSPRRFRERLTLFVDTPFGVKTGTSVIEYVMAFQDGWWGGLGAHMLLPGTRGEAAVIDLEQRGLLFALSNNDKTRRKSARRGAIAWVAFPDLEAQAESAEHGESTPAMAHFMDSLNRLKPRADVDINALPLLVRFRDISDPRTVERVDPNDLAASFGVGVTLTHATEEITDDPLTTGIEKRLPWLESYIARGAYLDGNASGVLSISNNPPLASSLGTAAFRTGI